MKSAISSDPRNTKKTNGQPLVMGGISSDPSHGGDNTCNPGATTEFCQNLALLGAQKTLMNATETCFLKKKSRVPNIIPWHFKHIFKDMLNLDDVIGFSWKQPTTICPSNWCFQETFHQTSWIIQACGYHHGLERPLAGSSLDKPTSGVSLLLWWWWWWWWV